MSKSIEKATFNEATNVDRFIKLLQLSVNEEIMSRQLSSLPVKPNKRTTPSQTADNELEKWSIIVYGVSQSKTEVAAHGVRHDKVSLDSYFKSALAKDESITLCKAFRLGTLGSNSTEMLQGHSVP